MLIIVNSMPKCGSTWFHEYMQACVVALGHPKAHDAVRDFPVSLNWRGNPGPLQGGILKALLAAAQQQTYVIKAHAGPTPELLTAMRGGEVAAVYIIRHPENVVKSAITYGQFCRQRLDLEKDSHCANIHTQWDALDFVKPFIDCACQWLQTDQTQVILRYEDLFGNGDAPILALARRLFPPTAEVAQTILDQMRPERLSKDERAKLRINLNLWPELDEPTRAVCREWAKRLGYL